MMKLIVFAAAIAFLSFAGPASARVGEGGGGQEA